MYRPNNVRIFQDRSLMTASMPSSRHSTQSQLNTIQFCHAILQALKPVGVAAVAVLALYSRQPPSTMKPGAVIKPGGAGMAACAFLPAVLSNGCAPIRAAVTETGSLVVFKGGQQVRFS